jgi:hypothetical protein
MHPNLSFEQAPPISVPYRFFLTAPWFGVAAGLLLAWSGESAVASRWTSVTLALTHLVVVGFMLQAMSGALLQFVPVVAGGNVWRPLTVARGVHPMLVLAAIVLVAAFLTSTAVLFRLAAGLFVLTVAFLVGVVGRALLGSPAQGATIRALRMALIGLAVTVCLGAALAEGMAGSKAWPIMMELANVHAAWGLGGWALLLVAGVSYFVVPMFQLTPAYPVRYARWLPPLVFAVLTVWSWQLTGGAQGWQRLVWLAGLVVAASYAGVTLWLQSRRRRRVTDPTLLLFRGAMLCLLGVLLSAIAMLLLPSLAEEPRSAYWLGVLLLPGMFMSVINGMLYKIVPFLSWLHLQRLMGLGTLPPNMKDMIPERAMMRQLRLHFAALVLLLAGTFWPELARLGGILLALSCALLGGNLIRVARFFRDFRDRIRAGEPGRE